MEPHLPMLLTPQPRDELPAGVPVAGETWDAFLNDTEGRHVHAGHVRQALNDARGETESWGRSNRHPRPYSLSCWRWQQN